MKCCAVSNCSSPLSRSQSCIRASSENLTANSPPALRSTPASPGCGILTTSRETALRLQICADRVSVPPPATFLLVNRGGFGAAAHNQCVEIRTVERIHRDAHADPGTHGAARFIQQTQVIDRLAHLPIREFEGG